MSMNLNLNTVIYLALAVFTFVVVCCFLSFRKVFLSSSRLTSVLTDRAYLGTFTPLDLKVRKVSSLDEYIDTKIKPSVSSFSLRDKIRLTRLGFLVDWQVFKAPSLSYLDVKKLSKIPWRFGLVVGDDYEDGLSHTRKDVIVLSRRTLDTYSDSALAKTILHEKVHLYQKKYPKDAQNYVEARNFKRSQHQDKRRRANPDTDGVTYMGPSGAVYTATYREGAKSILDVDYPGGKSQLYEHPYEAMCIESEGILNF